MTDEDASDAAGAMTIEHRDDPRRRAGRRAARLPRSARRRLDRHLCRAQRRARLGRRSCARSPRTAAARSRRCCPARRWSTRPSGPQRDRGAVAEPRAPTTRAPRRTRWSPTGPGLLLGILTADCVPVLLADGEAGVVGAAHAGWKGAIGGVIDATVAAMEALGARRDAHRRRDRPVHRARQLRGRRRLPRALLRGRPRERALLPGGPRRPPPVRHRGLCRRAPARWPGVRADRGAGARHLCR